MTFRDVVTRLEHGLRHELPGLEAQARLSPIPRRDWPAGFNQARIRNAAGLLLVFPKADTPITINAENAAPAESETHESLRAPRALRSPPWENAHIVLTVRAGGLRHGGQVSLPGGVVEPGETLEQAALREAHEEVALPLGAVRVLGALTPLDIPVSGFRLHPIVAMTETQPPLLPADGEVAGILEAAVDELLDPANLVRATRERDGIEYIVPAFRVCGHDIWGATAMVLAEFLAVLGWARTTPS